MSEGLVGGKYQLLSLLGQGGMGVVWRARHVELGRDVALKRLHADHASETSLQRFVREAQSAASVRAPNVIDVIDYGRDEAGDPYLVMEFLDGLTLEQRLRASPEPSLDQVLDWVDQALTGLIAIHARGIVHRDLKPANLFLAGPAEQPVVKVLDFGIARPSEPDASALTHTMQTLGTPHYMSPEQVRSAKTVDARTDLYAMGVILFQAATGRLPFEGPSATAVIAAIVTEDPPRVRELAPDVPDSVARVIERAMAKRPEDRFETASDLRDALRAARRGTYVDAPSTTSTRPTRSVSRRGLFAMLGTLASLGAAGWFATVGLRPHAEVAPATVAPASLPRGAAVAIPSELRVGTPDEFARIAAHWRALPSDAQRAFRVAECGPDARCWVVSATEAERIQSWGFTTAPWAPSAGAEFTPELLVTNVRANVRGDAGQSSALLATLPEGALVVALVPTTNAADANWLRVVASGALEGFIARRLVTEAGSCAPSPELFDVDDVLSRATLREEGRRYEAFFAVRGPRVRVYETDAACRLALVHELHIDGQVADLFVTSTVDRGESVLVLGEWSSATPPRDGIEHWTARRIASLDRVDWEVDLHSGQNLPDSRREGLGGPFSRGPNGAEGFYPLRIRDAHSRRWLHWDEASATFVEVGAD